MNASSIPAAKAAVNALLATACLLIPFVLLAPSSLAGDQEVSVEKRGRLERILQRGRLIVGVKSDYEPWGMIDQDGNIIGLEADLAKDVADRLGVALELVSVTTTNRLQRLEQGAVDLVIATMGDTEARRDKSDLLQPHYYESGVSLFAGKGVVYREWAHLRGRPICLTDGAYYNRALTERYLLKPVVFQGTRDTLIALRDGRCIGWAFDDTWIVAEMLNHSEWSDYQLALPRILSTPWAIGVKKGEGNAAFGRLVSDIIADWHRTGRLIELQGKWGLPPDLFLAEQHELWNRAGTNGPLCIRDEAGNFPDICLGYHLAQLGGGMVDMPGWGLWLQDVSGLDLTTLFDDFNQQRLLRGIALTLAISLVAIVGSLAVGLIVAYVDATAGSGVLSWLFSRPFKVLLAIARTPPILQLYILFFGLGGLLANIYGLTLSSLLVAGVVFSLYAGATNTALLRESLIQLSGEHPDTPIRRLIPHAIERCYEGLVATSVNIVKAAGLASVIAMPETISVVNTIIIEGGSADTMMNLLLIFYLLFVLSVLALLQAAKGVIKRWI